jgi:hypothetical protein
MCTRGQTAIPQTIHSCWDITSPSLTPLSTARVIVWVVILVVLVKVSWFCFFFVFFIVFLFLELRQLQATTESVQQSCSETRQDIQKLLQRNEGETQSPAQANDADIVPHQLPIGSLEELDAFEEAIKKKVYLTRCRTWAERAYKLSTGKGDHLKLLDVLYEFFTPNFLKTLNAQNFHGTTNIYSKFITKLVFAGQ